MRSTNRFARWCTTYLTGNPEPMPRIDRIALASILMAALIIGLVRP